MKLAIAFLMTLASISATLHTASAAGKSCKSGYSYNDTTKKCERESSY